MSKLSCQLRSKNAGRVSSAAPGPPTRIDGQRLRPSMRGKGATPAMSSSVGAGVVQGSFRTRKRHAVVADENDDRVVGEAIGVQSGEELTDLAVHSRDLVVVQREIRADFRRIRQKGRDRDASGIGRRRDGASLVGAMRVVKADPEKKWLVARALVEKAFERDVVPAVPVPALLHRLTEVD